MCCVVVVKNVAKVRIFFDCSMYQFFNVPITHAPISCRLYNNYHHILNNNAMIINMTNCLADVPIY